MTHVVPYEHRGKRYRELRISSQADVASVEQAFRREADPWLRKLLASKLREARERYDVDVPESDLAEAMRCRVL